MSLSTLVITASESTGDPAVNQYVVGGIAFGILFTLLLILLVFAGGREHS